MIPSEVLTKTETNTQPRSQCVGVFFACFNFLCCQSAPTQVTTIKGSVIPCFYR